MKFHNLWRNHTIVTTTSRGSTVDPSEGDCKRRKSDAPGIFLQSDALHRTETAMLHSQECAWSDRRTAATLGILLCLPHRRLLQERSYSCRAICGRICIMSTRTQGRIVRRPSLPLNERDVEDLQTLQSSEDLRLALEVLSPDGLRAGKLSESALLHAIWTTGMAAIREQAEAAGYLGIGALSNSRRDRGESSMGSATGALLGRRAVNAPWPLVRGRVYAAVVPPLDTEKFFIVVSNNQRNAALPQALAVRLTTSAQPRLASIIELSVHDPFEGRALCDDIAELYEDEVRRDLGALSARTMLAIGSGLKAALGIRN